MDTDLREDLADIKAWINHWSADRECGLLPSERSLAYVKAVVDRAIAKADTAAARSTVRVAA